MPDRRPSVRLDTEGAAAAPRRNGELVFASPWEARLFGMTMALHAAGRFEWEEFRRLLIEEIKGWERAEGSRPGATWSYYERWQAALERLLDGKGLCAAAELESRATALAARSSGHDH